MCYQLSVLQIAWTPIPSLGLTNSEFTGPEVEVCVDPLFAGPHSMIQ